LDKKVYEVEARIESTHWWYAVRRRLFSRFIRQISAQNRGTALDVGCGTGANLRILHSAGFKEIQGLDWSQDAVNYCVAKNLGPVKQGDICNLPFADNSIDLILVTDVIEHIDDDHKAMSEISRVLKPGGRVIISVPAFPILWGFQDIVAHHKRRYRMKSLTNLVVGSGLSIRKKFHCNFILFFPILLARQFFRIFPAKVNSEDDINNRFFNAVFSAIFEFDVRIAPFLHPPFGVSIVMVVEKP
jgi:SAM-dependent methyltransferase